MQCTVPSAGPQSGTGNRIAELLEQSRRAIEDRFVVAGEILQVSLSGTGELIGSLDRLAAIFDAGMAAATHADLILAAAKLCTLPACHASHVEAIGRLNRAREKLAQHASVMRCSLAFMGGFTRNATLVASSGTDSARISGEVAVFVHESSRELEAFDLALAGLQHDLVVSATRGEMLGRKIAALLPAVPDELNAAARVVSDHYKAVAAAAEHVSAIARDIQKLVTRLLAALQFGDITRQRIEHLLASLVRAEADAAMQPRATRQRFKATCYGLIAAQLADIDADFAREIAAIEQATAEIAACTEALLDLHDVAFARDGGRNSGFLHVLATRLDAAIALVATIEAADRAAVATDRKTLEAVRRLTGRIDRVQVLRNGMHTTADGIAELADDTPLTDIASEIRAQELLLEDAARVGLSTLDTLLHLTGMITRTSDGRHPKDSRAAAAAAALRIASRRIREARDMTETDICEIAAKGDAVIDMLALSEKRLRLRQEIGEIIALAATEAADRAADAYALGDDLPEALIYTLAAISADYTMARERSVHHAFAHSLALDFQETSDVPGEDAAELF